MHDGVLWPQDLGDFRADLKRRWDEREGSEVRRKEAEKQAKLAEMNNKQEVRAN